MVGQSCDLGVAARVIEDNKILLVKEAHGNYAGKWGLPKGYVESGESPEAAVLRELSEETGSTGTIIGLAAVRSTTSNNIPAVFLCYDVSIETKKDGHESTEIIEYGWFSLEQLKDLDWISETMHNLAIEGLSGFRMSIQPRKPLSKSGQSYYVYSMNKHSKLVT